MLKTGGYLNIIIALGHIIALIWAKATFRLFGIDKQMATLAQTHNLLPYVATLVVAAVFFVFGLYGLSGAGKYKRLPFLKVGIFSIGGIYLLRGLLEVVAAFTQGITPFTAPIAIGIGLLYVLGGWQRAMNN